MSEVSINLYEGLFLVDQGAVASNYAGALSHVQEMFDRAGADVLALRKWDERRLAHPVKNQKRGTYLLALFRVNAVQIANIERDCNLSEQVLRVMFTRADHFGETEINAALEEAKNTAAEAKLRETPEAETGESAAGDEQPVSAPVTAAAEGGDEAETSKES